MEKGNGEGRVEIRKKSRNFLKDPGGKDTNGQGKGCARKKMCKEKGEQSKGCAR